MDSPSRALNVLILVGGVATVLFMLQQIRATLKKGVIERRQPLTPFTRAANPRAFWGFVAFTSLTTAGIIWGLVVVAMRLNP